MAAAPDAIWRLSRHHSRHDHQQEEQEEEVEELQQLVGLQQQQPPLLQPKVELPRKATSSLNLDGQYGKPAASVAQWMHHITFMGSDAASNPSDQLTDSTGCR